MDYALFCVNILPFIPVFYAHSYIVLRLGGGGKGTKGRSAVIIRKRTQSSV